MKTRPPPRKKTFPRGTTGTRAFTPHAPPPHSTGTGVVTLSAASTYTGATVLSGGTVQLGQSGLAVTVPNFSFETPSESSSPYYAYTPSGGSWTFNNAGIAY